MSLGVSFSFPKHLSWLMSAHVVNGAGALEKLQERMLCQQCSCSSNCSEQRCRTTLAATFTSAWFRDCCILKLAALRRFWSLDSPDATPTTSVQLLPIVVGQEFYHGSQYLPVVLTCSWPKILREGLADRIGTGLEHIIYRDGLGILGLYSLKMRRLSGFYQCLQVSYRRVLEDIARLFLEVHSSRTKSNGHK